MIGKNSPCWCGSGKKYKHCHEEWDNTINVLKLQGKIVPSHNLIKSEEDIKWIKKAAKINNAVLDLVGEKICAGMTMLLSAAGASAVRYPLPRAAHAGLFGVLCSDVLESVTDLSGVMGSDHHAAGDALRVFIPPPYAHPVHSRASCGFSLLPYHADGAERRRQVHEKPRADRSGTAARASRAEHRVCAGSVSSSGIAARRSAFRFRCCKRRGAPGRARQLL